MFLKELMLIKTSESKECDICHYWYFLFHDLLMMFMNLRDIAILNIKSTDYHCIIIGICKNEVINLMQNANLTEKSESLKDKKNYFHI